MSEPIFEPNQNRKRVVFVFGRGCPHCEEVMNTELFKNISDVAEFGFDEIGFWLGADYSDVRDIVERRYGFSTPSVIVDPLIGDPFVFENRLTHYAYVYQLLGVRLKGRKRKSITGSRSRSGGKVHGRKRREFVETKKIAKEVAKETERLEACEEEGECREG